MTPPDSSAPGGKPFYYTPGEEYVFPPPGYSIELWDDDLNNTVYGYIPTKRRLDCPAGVGDVPNTDMNLGCWDKTQYAGVNNKYVEDPVHIEMGAYIGSADWHPGTSRWWFPYQSPIEGTAPRADFTYNDDPMEDLKQEYRCSEYNPTLPGLNWHNEPKAVYDGNVDQKLHYPNTHPNAAPCWGGLIKSDKLNVTYEHYKDSTGRLWTNRTRLTVKFKEEAEIMNTNIPNPQRIICLTWKGMVGTANYLPIGNVEKSRCWAIIFNVKPKLSVCVNTDGIYAPDSNKCGKKSLFKVDNANGRNGAESVIPVGVGQRLQSFVYFEDANRDMTHNCTACDTVEISVVSDPGLPNKATLGGNKGPRDVNNAPDAPSREVPVVMDGQQTHASYFQYSREFIFQPDSMSAMKVSSLDTPGALRNGLKYKVCFFATSTTQTYYPAGVSTQKSDTVCAYIQVVRPEPVLNPVVQLQPDDENLPMVADLADLQAPFKARVRCPYKWRISTYDLKDRTGHTDNFGFRYETDFVSGFKTGTYVATAKMDPQHPGPHGMRLMQEPGSDHQILSWSPDRGTEAQTFSFCLLITERHVNEGSYRRCTSIEVQKCEVCGLPSDSLHSISLEYKTDWLQLWGANYLIENPNMLQDYVKLKLGPMYTLNKNESTGLLAARFSMTSAGLLELNPDLKGQDVLEAGTHVCLVPRICGAV